jgi:hypothetical protein
MCESRTVIPRVCRRLWFNNTDDKNEEATSIRGRQDQDAVSVDLVMVWFTQSFEDAINSMMMSQHCRRFK